MLGKIARVARKDVMSELKIPPDLTTQEIIEENTYEARMYFLNPAGGPQDKIVPYIPPEPTQPRYSLVRPEGYRTSDAETLTLEPGSTERVACFVAALVRPVIMPGDGDIQQWLMWDVHGIQSVDTTHTANESVRLFIDKDVDKSHTRRLLLRHDTAAWFVRQTVAGEDSEAIIGQLGSYFTENSKQIEQAKPLVDTIDMIFERDYNLELNKAAKLRLQTIFLDTLDGSNPTDAPKCHTCASSEPLTIASLTTKH